MLTLVVLITVFVGVATLVGAVAILFRGDANPEIEGRLEILTGKGKANGKAEGGKGEQQGGITRLSDGNDGALEEFISRHFNLRLFLDQAAMETSVSNFIMLTAGLAGAGAVVPFLLGLPFYIGPVLAVILGIVPLGYVWFKRGKRLAKFGNQLPDALELIARALRAGHSLGAGFHLVSEEMLDPIGGEFRKVFESQNLGVPLEEAIVDMTERVPNLDLKFFGTAVILQRQTGGDLAEILDKIGRLVRQRMELFGQIQALTGEGRISGIVLLGMPPALFIVMWYLNPTYVMTLFTDPLGQKMLAGAIVMQLIGAWVIQKIIDIKV
ncbi:type II secretion system F family protein [Bremerella sp. P1]|uniref:type II secretion system F family protein n=1 Tax=Bremerella sp. P1 TaxID=3026424 RepID=UPI002368701F|nr:type II secretion system F family protein [Bremerella sp. P1]WDI41329.1 type II secretion system F family protein [Bremerella sp. P1]